MAKAVEFSIFCLIIMIYFLYLIEMREAKINCNNFDMKKPPRFGKRSQVIAEYDSNTPCLKGPQRRMSMRRSTSPQTLWPLFRFLKLRQNFFDLNE
jgi:hypothetical protein